MLAGLLSQFQGPAPEYEQKAEFRRQHDFVTTVFDGLDNEFLIYGKAANLGGVDESDAEVECPVDRSNGCERGFRSWVRVSKRRRALPTSPGLTPPLKFYRGGCSSAEGNRARSFLRRAARRCRRHLQSKI